VPSESLRRLQLRAYQTPIAGAHMQRRAEILNAKILSTPCLPHSVSWCFAMNSGRVSKPPAIGTTLSDLSTISSPDGHQMDSVEQKKTKRKKAS
jgi:hypothetical protein